MEPVISCRVVLPEGADPRTALAQLRQLAQEDPQLYPEWEEQKREIRVRLMGEIQREILQSVAMERFGLAIGFEEGSILYKETIAAPVEGIGHYEPLRHYAEVHLLMEPLPPGSGLQFACGCPTDRLDLNWQRLILTHLAEKTHKGVLTGAPITDMKITLIAGRAHPKPHRGRGLPRGDLPGGAAGAADGGKHPAGAAMPLYPDGAGRAAGAGTQ